MEHVRGRDEVHTGFWWEILRERDHLEDLGLDGRISKWIFEKQDGSKRLRIETGGGLLRMR
jgi:hypothetical protein